MMIHRFATQCSIVFLIGVFWCIISPITHAETICRSQPACSYEVIAPDGSNIEVNTFSMWQLNRSSRKPEQRIFNKRTPDHLKQHYSQNQAGYWGAYNKAVQQLRRQLKTNQGKMKVQQCAKGCQCNQALKAETVSSDTGWPFTTRHRVRPKPTRPEFLVELHWTYRGEKTLWLGTCNKP